MKNIHRHFIHHLRAYRTFHFMFFTFILLITSIIIHNLSNKGYAAGVQKDLLEQAFEPAMQQETIVNLGAGKNAVGNEVLREGVNVQDYAGQGCFVHNEHISKSDLETQKTALGSHLEDREFCEQILGGDYNTTVLQTEAPLIVRIAKFLLRITMVLSVTMVIFNGIMWIIESSKGAEVKDAKKNITLIIGGILISLMSLGIINLISSLTVSSLSTSSTQVNGSCSINDNVLIGDDLKAYICRYIYNGNRYNDRVGNRCRKNYYINGTGNFDAPGADWVGINDQETIEGCINLGGVYNN